MVLMRSWPTKVWSFSSMVSISACSKSASVSNSFNRYRPAGGRDSPRLVPSAPVAKTRSSSICGRLVVSLVSGMKIRS